MAIYISEDLYLSGALNSGYINGNNPRVGYINYVTFGGITAFSETAANPAINLANDATNLYWESNSTAEQHLEFNIEFNTFNYVGIAGHNLSGSQYQIQYGNGGAFTNATGLITPTSNDAIMHLISPQSAELVRIRIIPKSGLKPKIAIVYIGQYLTLSARLYVGHTPIVYARNTTFSAGVSDWGDYLGKVKKRTRLSNSLKQDNVDPIFYRNYIEPFVDHAETKPFFVAWRPEEYPKEVGFCWTTDDIKMENEKANGFVRFDMRLNGLAPWPEE